MLVYFYYFYVFNIFYNFIFLFLVFLFYFGLVFLDIVFISLFVSFGYIVNFMKWWVKCFGFILNLFFNKINLRIYNFY